MGSFINNALGNNNGYNSASAANNITQQNFAPQLATAQQGVQSNIANQNSFAQALQNQMNGAGPNLANSQLANATGQNVSNQAALMASQRGAGSNAGLIARQAAQQGAGIQQQAAGQAAVNRQQQQLGAQSQLGNVYGNIGAEQGQNLATVQGAQTAQNNTISGAQQAANSINAQTATANSAQNANTTNGIVSGVGAAFGLAEGGVVPKFATGGMQQSDINNSMFANPSNPMAVPLNSTPLTQTIDPNQPRSMMGKMLQAGTKPVQQPQQSQQNQNPAAQAQIAAGKTIGSGIGGGLKSLFGSSPSSMGQSAGADMSGASVMVAKGGKIDALVSPGERFLKPKEAKAVAKGKVDPMKVGEKIPGKPKVPGAVDSYTNDTVPKKLDIGGIVIPRHITMGKNPANDAAKFVQAIIDKQGKKKAKS